MVVGVFWCDLQPNRSPFRAYTYVRAAAMTNKNKTPINNSLLENIFFVVNFIFLYLLQNPYLYSNTGVCNIQMWLQQRLCIYYDSFAKGKSLDTCLSFFLY